MEKVEGLLQNLKLSEAERKGLRLGSDGGKCKVGEAKAFGKVLSEKPANSEGLQKSLGPIWCPLKGLRCKDLRNNVSLPSYRNLGRGRLWKMVRGNSTTTY